MIGAWLALAAALAVGQPADSDLDSALGATVVDGLTFESDIQWHRGDYARAGMARLLGAELLEDDYIAYVDAAWLAWSWEHTDLGRLVCRRALEMNPSSAPAAYEVAVLVELWGDDAWSLRLLRRAHELDPQDRLTAVALGAALRELGRWDDAAKVYRALKEHHPDYPSADRFLDRYEAWGHMHPTPDGREEQ
ncbi:MAG: hypothetical protein GF320_05450 [Armatimonadia bacterium]|nr:hypothetical protein [Armatimonadia bacterium]